MLKKQESFTVTFQGIQLEDVIKLVGMKYIKSFNSNVPIIEETVSSDEDSDDELEKDIELQNEKDKFIDEIRSDFKNTFREVNKSYKNEDVRRRKLQDLTKKMNNEIDKVRNKKTLPKKKSVKQKKKVKKIIDTEKHIAYAKDIQKQIISKRASAIKIAEREDKVTKECTALMKEVDKLQRTLYKTKMLLKENGVNIKDIEFERECIEESSEEESDTDTEYGHLDDLSK